MQNLWSDKDARAAVKKYALQGVNEDLALRVYTTRLLGGEPRLVQHGGGNTSVKTTIKDDLGETVEVLCVKGSGWEMSTIDPPGLPAVRFQPLLKLKRLKALSDERMVNLLRGNLIDATAPTPSVEALLHAFVPHKFIDHTHASAVLALVDRADGASLARELYGRRMGIVPYIMPGFALAKTAMETFEEDPGVHGLILHKHGIFTFGGTAREAYERMIEMVSRAERHVGHGAHKRPALGKLPKKVAALEDVAPILRGLTALPVDANEGRWTRFILEHRAGAKVMQYVNGRDLARYSQAGTVTPDHAIRTKPKPLVLPAPEAGKLEEFVRAARAAIERYQRDYRAYFERHNARANPKKKALDRMPRVILVPGLGLFGLGAGAKEARTAADLAETCVNVVLDVEATGRFESIPEKDMFDIEYWSLEQAKLSRSVEKPLQRQVAVVTGAGGTIGAATAAALRSAGAEIVLLDLDAQAAQTVGRQLDGLALACDVTSRASVRDAFARAVRAFGGVDIVVSNAGAAWEGRIGEVPDETLRRSFELNFFAHQYVAQAAVRVMRAQQTGGALLFNVSKQAVNPGPNFGPYGLPKAATMALMRQYAVDYGADGITSNAVNADRIRSGVLTNGMIRSRAKARGVTEKLYMAGNLLNREVRAQDVADAFVALALSRKTTGAVLTVDGGNIAAALR
ncbi:MAG: bifunctional aldolase/short-chain dehydrogenase [Tepidisphaeraceae bacterium]